MAKPRDIVIGLIIAGVALAFIVMVVFSLIAITRHGGMTMIPVGDRIGIVEVEGPIDSSEDIVRQLKKYDEDGSVPAIVLRINSPGGAVAPTQEIFDQIIKARANGTYIIASLSSVAASGGYYIACAADTIIANPGTLTGSIGVIFSFMTFEGLMDKVGVQLEVVKTGEMKDVGNYSREMTQREREMLQGALNDVYNQFVLAIAQNRNLEVVQVEELADGSIFTGNQALELGLVDKLGGLEDAISLAGEMTGLGKNPRIIKEYPRQPSLVDYLLGKAAAYFDLKGPAQAWPKLEYIYK